MKTDKKLLKIPKKTEGESTLFLGDRYVYGILRDAAYPLKDENGNPVLDDEGNEVVRAKIMISSLARRIGCGRPFVIESIIRLQNIGWINVRKDGKCNEYTFSNFKRFEMFSEDFFKDKDIKLDYRAKDFWIQLQPYVLLDKINKLAYIRFTATDIAKALNLSVNTVIKYLNIFKKADVIRDARTSLMDPNTGNEIWQKDVHLDKIHQAFLYKLGEHDVRITNLEEDLKATNARLEKEIEELKAWQRRQELNSHVSYDTGEPEKKELIFPL